MLTDDELVLVAQRLDVDDLQHLQLVCRQTDRVMHENSDHIWKECLKQHVCCCELPCWIRIENTPAIFTKMNHTYMQQTLACVAEHKRQTQQIMERHAQQRVLRNAARRRLVCAATVMPALMLLLPLPLPPPLPPVPEVRRFSCTVCMSHCICCFAKVDSLRASSSSRDANLLCNAARFVSFSLSIFFTSWSCLE